MTELTLADVDRDEVLTEAIAQLCGSTRAGFLRTAALGGAAMLAALAAPGEAAAKVTDLEILNFGLRFERLQATFYTQAEQLGTIRKMSEAKQRWAETLGAHERAHVKILLSVLGKKAGPKPFFDFGAANETDAAFTRTAVAMEDLTVALLTGVTPQLQDRRLTAALMGLLTVEARHAAWARRIVRTTPAPAAFDGPRTLDSVRGAVARTHFIVSKPKMTAKKRPPRFTG
jgi:Ferritin-like domain